MPLFRLSMALIIIRVQVLASRFERLMPKVVSHVPKVQRPIRHSGARGVPQPMRGGTGELIGASSIVIASLSNVI